MSIVEADVCRDYRLAKNKNEQIKILAELNDTKPDVILDILTRHGKISGVKPAPNKKRVRVDWSVMDKEVQRLAQEGLKATEIAERLGIDVNKIYDRRHYRKKQADKLTAGDTTPPSRRPPQRETDRSIPFFSGDRSAEALGYVVAQLEAMGFAIGCATYDVLKGELTIVGKTRKDDKR